MVLPQCIAVADAPAIAYIARSKHDWRRLLDILTRTGKTALSQDDAQAVLDEADVNGDGELDISEFIQLMKSRTPGL